MNRSDQLTTLPTGSGRFLWDVDSPRSDLQRDATTRLSIFALTLGAICAIALFLFSLLPMFGGPVLGPQIDSMGPLCVLILILSAVILLLARSARLSPRTKMDLGLLYVIILCATISYGLHLTPGGPRLPLFGVSEICVLLIFFPVIVPNRPIKILITALLAASMDPLAVYLSPLVGNEAPPFPRVFESYVWNYIYAGLALVPSHVLAKLGQEVHEARKLGSYKLVERLGEGGMGEVWMAKHRMLARPAAIKLIRSGFLRSRAEPDREVVLKRFELEAQATASLSSPHTIDLYDFGITEDGTFYYVMELLEGIDMRRMVEQFGPLRPERVVHLLKQVCHSLGEAHEQGLIHRDIKPANLYVCRFGRELDFAKVLDLGLVKPRHENKEDSMDLSGQNITGGTPAYMAPEQILKDRPVDGRTDIYALGCVAYWLLTGKLVFEGKTAIEVMMHHTQTTPPLPSSRTEMKIPESLERVVLACLEKDPDNRPADADVLSQLLSDCTVESAWTP